MLALAALGQRLKYVHLRVQFGLIGALTLYRVFEVNLHVSGAAGVHVPARLLTLPVLAGAFYLTALWTDPTDPKDHGAGLNLRGLFAAAGSLLIATLIYFEVSGPWVAVALLLPASIGTTAATANGLSALMTVIPNQMRAQSSALYYLVVNVFGLTLGPTGIALFTDYVFRDTTALRYSVACISAIAGVLSASFLIYNLSRYRRAFVESETWVTEA